MVPRKPIQDNKLERLHEILHSLVNKHKTLDRIARDFGIDERLIGSEIHTITTVGENPMSNISQLAKKMGVTKAATSQMIRKLQFSGYLRKLRDEKNKREILVDLTDKGLKAFNGHRVLWQANCAKFLNDLTDDQIESFNSVAEKIIGLAEFEIRKNTRSSLKSKVT